MTILGPFPGRVASAFVALWFTVACTAAPRPEEECQIVQSATALMAGLEETSGVAASRDHEGIIWTHNDSGGDPEVVAVRATGDLVGRVRLDGAEAVDWEDMALGACPTGTCVYVADIGDGGAQRSEIQLYRAPEPDPTRDEQVVAERFPMRYPGGPRDAEAMFVLPSGEVYFITKGRSEPVELYRYPLPLRPDETVTLERVLTLAAGAQPLELQVTGASASPSGEWVAVRTYKHLALRRTDELLAGSLLPALSVNLQGLGEPQGEAVHLLDNGAVILTTEGGFPGALGSLAIVRCEL